MILKTNQRMMLTVKPTDAEGDVVRIDGAVSWSSDPGGKVEITPVDDTSAWVYGVTNGHTVIRAVGDADLDAGESRPLAAEYRLEVINAEDEASLLTIEAGEPEEV